MSIESSYALIISNLDLVGDSAKISGAIDELQDPDPCNHSGTSISHAARVKYRAHQVNFESDCCCQCWGFNGQEVYSVQVHH